MKNKILPILSSILTITASACVIFMTTDKPVVNQEANVTSEKVQNTELTSNAVETETQQSQTNYQPQATEETSNFIDSRPMGLVTVAPEDTQDKRDNDASALERSEAIKLAKQGDYFLMDNYNNLRDDTILESEVN